MLVKNMDSFWSKLGLLALGLLLGGLVVWATQVLWQPGFPYTHDGENHLARFANYKIALREGQFPPRFAPNLFNRYGYPVFNFNYPLANILSAPFSAVGVHYETTFKLIVFFGLWSGALGAWFWLKRLLPDLRAGFYALGVILWLASPFLTNAIVFRGNIGEILAYSLLPWLLWSIEWWRKSPSQKDSSHSPKEVLRWLILVGVWTMFLLSHNSSVLVAGFFLGVVALVRLGRNWQAWRQAVLVGVLSLGLSFWFWLPALAEAQWTVVMEAENQRVYGEHFPTLTQLLFAPVEFGYSYAGSIDPLSFALGASQWFLLGLSLVWLGVALLKQNLSQSLSKQGLLFSVLAVIFVFLQLSSSQFIWELVPPMRYLQFPWRLGLFFAISVVPVAVLVLSRLRWRYLTLMTLVILAQFLLLADKKPADRFHKQPIDYDSFTQSTSTQNENRPITFTYQDIADWQPSPSVLVGEAQFDVDFWDGSVRQYRVSVLEKSLLVEPTMWFPGWMTEVSDQPSLSQSRVSRQPGSHASQPQPQNYVNNDLIAGRLAYWLEPGDYLVKTRFTQQTWSRQLGHGVTLISFGVVMLLAWFRLSNLRWQTSSLRQRALTLQRFISLWWKRALTIPKRISRDWRAISPWWWVVGAVIVWRLLLLATGMSADLVLPYAPSFPYAERRLETSQLPRWLYSWGGFDGVHYLDIAEHGYAFGLIQAFFPLFPSLLWLAWQAGLLIVDWDLVASSFLVSHIFLLTASLVWWRFAVFELGASRANWALAVLLLFPTSLFLGAIYSEALFLSLVVGSFWSARKKRWWLAGILAGLATATRIVGVALIPALLYELYWQKRDNKPLKLPSFWSSYPEMFSKVWSNLWLQRKALLAISLGVSGISAYSLYLWWTFGNPLYFFQVQPEFGSGRETSLVMYPVVVFRYLKMIITMNLWSWTGWVVIQELAAGLIGLALLLLGFWRKIRPSYLLFGLIAFLLPTLTGTFSSLPRYLLVIFPIFLVLAQWLSQASWKTRLSYLTISALLLIINTILFVQGYWLA